MSSEEEPIAALGIPFVGEDRPGPASAAELIYDLEVRQTELEMQNRELRETQHALEASQARYRDLYELAPVAYFTLDRETVIQEANLTAGALLGVDGGQLVGRPLALQVSMADRARFREAIGRCLENKTRVVAEVQLASKRRPAVVVQVTCTPLLDGEGQVRGCRTAFDDISARKRSEERLSLLANASRILSASLEEEAAAIEAVLGLLVPSFGDIVLLDVVDEGGALRRMGRVFGEPELDSRLGDPDRMLGARLPPGAPQIRVMSNGLSILIPDGIGSHRAEHQAFDYEPLLRAAGARSLVFAALASRGIVQGVLTLVSTDAGRQFSDADRSMVQDLGARIASTLDNARFYRRSLAAVKAREEVLAFVAHDLRNPLHAALLSTAQLLNDSPAQERRRGWRGIERVHRMAERMSRMIDDLLDVASLDAGRLPIQLGPHDVRGLIADVLEELQSPAEVKGVELQVRLPAQPCVVRCDRRRILQVFSNVVSNAVKFTPRGGTITISSRNSGSEILFSIEDTGPGVPPENLQRLFERYWQADERSQKGRGLGLYIARRIVEAQSGVIWAESQLGSGTTISFSLPRDPDDRPPGPLLDAGNR